MTSRKDKMKAQKDEVKADMVAFCQFASTFQQAKWYRHECTIWDRFGKRTETKTLREKFSAALKSAKQCSNNFDSADRNNFGMIIKTYGQTTVCPSSSLSATNTDTYYPKYIAKGPTVKIQDQLELMYYVTGSEKSRYLKCEIKRTRLANTWKDWYRDNKRPWSSPFVKHDLHDILQQFNDIWDEPLPPNYDVATINTSIYEKEIRACIFASGVAPRIQTRTSGNAQPAITRSAVAQSSPILVGDWRRRTDDC